MQEDKPKISLPEGIIVGFYLFFLPDLIEFLLIFFGLDDFWISDLLAFPGSMIYLKMKGVKITYSLVCNLAELIPYAGFLPLRTIGFAITAIIENNKNKITKGLEITEKGAKVAKIVPGIRQQAEAVEKGAKIAKKTMEYSKRGNLKSSSINITNSFNNIKKPNPVNKESFLNNKTVDIKNQPKPNNIDIENFSKKDYNKVEIDDNKNIVNLKNAI